MFAKIIRNECDEDFYWVQQNVKTTVRDIMVTYHKVKNPFKQISDVERMVESRCNGVITRGECHDILKHIYQTNDMKIVTAELDLYCGNDPLS